MKKYIRVTMPDRSKWDILASFIANIRAKYYVEKGRGDSENSIKIYKEEFEYGMTDSYELEDWLSNNMNWDDVKVVAEKVSEISLTSDDLQEGIMNGEKEIIEK